MAFPNRYFEYFFGSSRLVPVRKNEKAAVRCEIRFLVPSSDQDRVPDFPNQLTVICAIRSTLTMALKANIAEVMCAKRYLEVIERAVEEGEEEDEHEVAHDTKRAGCNYESEGMIANYIHEIVAANSREAGRQQS